MKCLLSALSVVLLFSCRKDIQIQYPITFEWKGLYNIEWFDDTEQKETIDTLYAWSHVWVGTSKWVDSAYSEFIAKESPSLTISYRRNRLYKDTIK